MAEKFIDRIAVKLVFWLVVFSSFLTFLVTGGQLYLEYNEDLRRLTDTIDIVANSELIAAGNSITTGDSGRINNFLDHLLLRKNLAYAAVVVDDKVAWEQGTKLSEHFLHSAYALPPGSLEQEKLPTLEVVTDIQPLYNEIVHRFIRISIVNGIKIFLIAGFVFLMFQVLVTRHLESLADQVSRLDMLQPFTPVGLVRKETVGIDELDRVVEGINLMQSKARDAIETLAENEKRLLLFFDSTEDAILGVDQEGLCSFANDSCLRMLGLSHYEDVIGVDLNFLFYFINEARCSFSADNLIKGCLENGANSQKNSGNMVLADGNSLPVQVRSYPVHTENRVSGAILFIKDNSEAQKLKYERELLSQAVEQLPVMVIIASSDNSIQFVNHGVEHLTGYSKTELLGRSLSVFSDQMGDSRSNLREVHAQVLSGSQWEGLIRTLSKNGVMLNLYCVMSPVFNNSGDVINSISVCREISYELALQKELINAKKMEAVERLSSSFAHEFGNPLFGVHSVLKDVVDRGQLGQEDSRLLTLARQECEKMREMVREFQVHYHNSNVSEIHQSVGAVVREVLDEVVPLIESEGIYSVVELGEDVEHLMINRNRFSLVLRNVLINAIESMAGTGGSLRLTGVSEGDMFAISVGDRGVGIKKEYQDFVFEPFFSTKATMEGAGLGLALAYSASRSLGGKITFTSKEGQGTVFKIFLPLSKANTQELAGNPAT